MLLEFSVSNYKSFKDRATFSMLDSFNSTKKHPNSFKHRKYHLLRTAVIFGANASGKSNLLNALSFMSELVINRDKVLQSTDNLKHVPFKLNTETENASTYFEIVFFIKEEKYRYGFDYDSKQIYEEWLFEDKYGREAKLFHRNTEEKTLYINKQKFKEGKNITPLNNHLFIWQCDRNQGKISKQILEWFSNLKLLDDKKTSLAYNISGTLATDRRYIEKYKAPILNLLKSADLGILDISAEHINQSNFTLMTKHIKYNDKNQEIALVNFQMNKEESLGTQSFFTLLGPILIALEKGHILLIDEFAASLHTSLAQKIIELFNDPEINKNNAQLIVANHDTNLLADSLFEKNQIWFTEKNQYNESSLFALLEFKGIRSANHEKNYLLGKYGAVPYLGDFEDLKGNLRPNEKEINKAPIVM